MPNSVVAKAASVLVGYKVPANPPIELIQRAVLLVADYVLDYSVIRLPVPVSSSFTPIQWRTSGPFETEPIAIIQHPNGEPIKVADDEDCYISRRRAEGRKGRLVDFGHRCDTMDGSSGSLVIALEDLRLIGIHHWGVRSDNESEQNQGVRIDEILKDLKQKASHSPGIMEIYQAVTSD